MKIKSLALFTLFSVMVSCHDTTTQSKEVYLQPSYWKDQALMDILPAWTRHVVDSANGSFFCKLDENWRPDSDTLRFPSMIARHLFGYSAGYMLSGDESHLAFAHQLKDYLLKYAWDMQYGGWYDALTPDGKPRQFGKSTFVQVYVITGLTLYYMVTHDEEVLDYINRTNNLLEANVWDEEHGGYFDNIERDWTKKNDVKSLSSQLAPVSGYLLYLYMATRNLDYLKQAERITDVIWERMRDPHTGWILESFDRTWNYLPAAHNESEVNVGHNLEIAWMLARLHMADQRPGYLEKCKILSDSIHHYGINTTTGFWYAGTGNENASQHTEYTHWWIQAYGQMFDLCMAKLYPEGDYQKLFLSGTKFWDQYFLDKAKGDTHLTVRENGEVMAAEKANQFKASYHNMEHALLNYLYLGLWINPSPVTLHFKITTGRKNEMLYPVPIEILEPHLIDVTIDGEGYGSSEKGGINLSNFKNASVTVRME